MRKTVKFYEIRRPLQNGDSLFLQATESEELANAVATDRHATYVEKFVEIEAPFEPTYCENCQCYMSIKKEEIVSLVLEIPQKHTYKCTVCGKEVVV